MIKLCIFDMGGVMIRDYHIGPELSEYLGYPGLKGLGEISPLLQKAVNLHSKGVINEDEVWHIYEKATGKKVPESKEPLLGKFFHPILDEPTVKIVEDLKKNGIRVVCGTNVIDIHYKIHNNLKQYDVFEKVYPSHLIGKRKPELEFYRYICKEEGVSPDEAFFTDDMKSNVDASKKAGLTGRVYTDADRLRKDLQDLKLL